jgi:hypothetical protein
MAARSPGIGKMTSELGRILGWDILENQIVAEMGSRPNACNTTKPEAAEI